MRTDPEACYEGMIAVLIRALPYFLVCLVFYAGEVYAKGVSPEDAARVEALYKEATELLGSGRLDEAAGRFQAAIQIDDRHAPSYVGLGRVALKQGDLKGAEKAFKQALRKRKKYAPAFNGMGLVYREKKNELRRAIRYFRDAMRADKTYAEAQYNLAQTYQRFGSSETLEAYKDVLKIDPKHPDASFQIGLIHERKTDYEKATSAYREQIEANPDHFGARLHLGIVLKFMYRTDESVGLLEGVVAAPSPYQRRALLELAQVYQRRREYDRSQALFEAYVAGLETKEQALYYDLSLAAGGETLEQFQAASPEAWKGLSEAFWAGRDPAPVTGANERLLEHYRRLAFAREHFGTYVFPWDARGEVYIRYGNPDHVSRSKDIRLERDGRVVAVKERLIARAGKAGALLARDRQAQVVASMKSMRGELRQEQNRAMGKAREQVAGSAILGWPVYPVDGIWEYWIYAGVGSGIEVTFVQRNYPGPYDYVGMPMGMGDIARIWREMHPQVQVQRAAARTPSTYRPDFATGPLNFFFYSAAFKGEAGETALEIYYGIPTGNLAYVAGEEGGSVARLVRGVAVYDEANRPVHRASQDMVLRGKGVVDTSAGTFIPEMDRVALPPGNYRLAVQVLDRVSGKSQVYKQDRLLQPYGDSGLKLSDIELAASIEVADRGRFLKEDIAVVPLASRAYLPGQPIFIYYEIYNLKRDEFGTTRYRVSYEVRSLEKKSIGARILRGLGKLMGKREEEGTITIEYEQTGVDSDERGYLELDMSGSEPGVQLLKVHVGDENSGENAMVTTTFTIRE